MSRSIRNLALTFGLCLMALFAVRWSGGSAAPSTNWAGWPCDEPAAKLRDAFLKAPDRPAQVAAAEALQKRMWEAGPPYVMNGQYDQPYVWRKNVTGVLPTGLLVFWNVSKE